MSVLMLLIPLSVLIAACFLAAFFWAVRSGQYEDTCTPALRILTEDAPVAAVPRTANPVEVSARPVESAHSDPSDTGAAVAMRFCAATAGPSDDRRRGRPFP
ncbi:MAG: cbb3-type cytochrome oxidase assembly protein CcoS [Verrucomicrobiota bacterium]